MPRHRTFAGAVALLFLGAGLSACGSLPRPFAHDPDRPAAGLSRLTSGTGVAVLSAPAGEKETASEDPAAEDPAAETMAAALRALDVPADTAEAPREGGYTLTPNAEGGWDLSGPGGRLLLALAAETDLAINAQRVAQAVEADALRPVTLRAAAAVGDSAGPLADAPLPALRVAAVEGLDAGRGRVLAGAVEEALRRAGVKVAADAPWTVAGRFERAPAAPGQPVPVRLTWRLIDPQGQESGAAEQANAVPADMLENGFAPLAAAIASGAAEGVVALAFEARGR